MTSGFWAGLGAVLGGVAVALGAFAAHGLKERLTPEMLAIFETGAKYQMYHALAILATGALATRGGAAANLAGVFFLLGIALFSGSLYVLAVTGMRWLGMITPFGGVSFLIGWAALAVAAFRSSKA